MQLHTRLNNVLCFIVNTARVLVNEVNKIYHLEGSLAFLFVIT